MLVASRYARVVQNQCVRGVRAAAAIPRPPPAAPFSTQRNLLYRAVPERYHAYLDLGRYDKPIGYRLLFWPCTWGVALAMPGLNILQFAHLFSTFYIGSVVMRAAGCIVNDMWDHEFDKRVERTRNRPLASQRLNFTQAGVFLGVHLLGGLGVLTQLNWTAIAAAFSIVPAVVLYPYVKRVSYYPQAVLGVCFNWGTVVGYAAVQNSIDYGIVLPAYAAGICWTLIYDTIYAHQDKADDQKIGVKSTALVWGHNTQRIATALNWTAFALLCVSAQNAALGVPFYPLLLASHAYLQYLINQFDIDNPQSCWKSFVANRHYGTTIMVAIIFGQLFNAWQKDAPLSERVVLQTA